MGGSKEDWGHFGDDNTGAICWQELLNALQCMEPFVMKRQLWLFGGSAEMAPESSLRQAAEC